MTGHGQVPALPSGAEDDLGTYLERAAAESEQLRTAVLAGVAGVALLLALALQAVAASRALPLPRLTEGPRSLPAVVFAASLLALELVAHSLARRRARTGALLPRAVSYGTPTLEISLLTVALALGARDGGPAALITPVMLGYFLLVALTVLRLDPLSSLFAGAMAGAQYVTLATVVLAEGWGAEPAAPEQGVPLYYVSRGAVLVLMGVAAAFVAWELRRRVESAWAQIVERQRVRRIFGEHSDPAVVDVILESGGGVVEGERRRVCVMFLDLRGYSSFADGRDPKEVVELLNRFFGICIPLVTAAGGVVHQLLGDGLMAVFGAPIRHQDDERRALECAQEIVQAVADAIERGDLPDMGMGIGLHAGDVVAGSIGTSSHREYKVTGDVVNMAARIEALTKELPARILASREVWTSARSPLLVGTSLGHVELRGHASPVELFSVSGRDPADATL